MKDSVVREQVRRLGRPAVDMLEREIARHERIEAYRRLACGILLSLVVTAALIILVTNLWLGVYQIDGTSMDPLLEIGEIVLTVKDDNPARGDVIAFYSSSKLLIKRVIATGGDRVEIGGDGAVFVNGNAINEPYVAEKSLGTCDIEFPFQVPAGTVFVLGDNRAVSTDSRSRGFGPVSREQIVGRVVRVLWPLRKAAKV